MKESPVLPVAMRKSFGAAGLATLRAGGFKEVMTKESVALEEQVYQALRAMNVVCTLEHGNWIDIPAMEAGHSWCVGTANENWGCDYNDDAELHQLRAQKHELLTALEDIADCADNPETVNISGASFCQRVSKVARAALSKVRGQ